MWKFLPYVWKNLLGHRVRTGMTIGGTALLMFLFSFVASIQQGLNRLLDTRDDRLIVYQEFRICPSSSALPGWFADDIRRDPRIKEVMPVKVVVNNCRASLDTVVFHGVEPATLRKVRQFRLLQGDWSAFEQRGDGALVGRKIAERRGLAPGQPFSVASVSVQVVGVFASEEPSEENLIYTHLNLLQAHQLGHHEDRSVTLFEVHVHDPEQAMAVAKGIDENESIRKRSEIRTETRPQKVHYQRALSDLIELIDFTRWLGFLCVGVVAVLVANSVIMAVQDRVKEHAVLQTLGFSGWRIFGLMLSESLLISLIGGAIGIIGCFAWLSSRAVTVSTEGVSIDFLATPGLAASGLGLSLLVGLVAGIVPAWQAGRAEIVASLR
jgi:putative ABC transport system permease protein